MAKSTSNLSNRRSLLRSFFEFNRRMFSKNLFTSRPRAPYAHWGIPLQVLMIGSCVSLGPSIFRGNEFGIWLSGGAVLLIEVSGVYLVSREPSP